MKIAVFLYSLGSGGAERQASWLIREFAKEHEVSLVLVHGTIFYDIPQSVEVHILDDAPLFLSPLKKMLKLPSLAKRYAAFCKERGIDVSLSFMNRPNYINILSSFFGNRAKKIVSERGTPSAYYKGLEGAVSKLLLKLLYPKADVVVSNSLGNQKDLKERFGLKNVETIYNMIDLQEIEEKSSMPCSLKKSGLTYITVGRLDGGKNHAMMIRAFKRSGVEGKLFIIGEGPLRKDLENLIRKENMQERVILLGRQENPYAYLHNADIFLFSSTNEGFPNVLLEALACGLPVISADCPSGPRELLCPDGSQKGDIVFGKYGVLVKNEDEESFAKAIAKLSSKRKLMENYSKIARNRAKDFSIEKIVPQWKKVIEG